MCQRFPVSPVSCLLCLSCLSYLRLSLQQQLLRLKETNPEEFENFVQMAADAAKLAEERPDVFEALMQDKGAGAQLDGGEEIDLFGRLFVPWDRLYARLQQQQRSRTCLAAGVVGACCCAVPVDSCRCSLFVGQWARGGCRRRAVVVVLLRCWCDVTGRAGQTSILIRVARTMVYVLVLLRV